MQLLSFALRGGHILRIRVTMGSLIVHVGEEHCNRQRERERGGGNNGGIDWRTHDQYLADGRRRRRRSATHKTSLCNAQSSRHTSGAQNVLFSPRKYVQSPSTNKIRHCWNASGTQTLYLIHLLGWKNYLFALLAFWGNKNWPPSMKVEKLEKFQTLMTSKGCKWSSLNGPGTETPLSHPVLELCDFPFLQISPLG